MKEQSAQGLGELIRRTSSDALKPSVVNITGPLIRVLGDRFQASVKVAVLDTLALLLGKVREGYAPSSYSPHPPLSSHHMFSLSRRQTPSLYLS